VKLCDRVNLMETRTHNRWSVLSRKIGARHPDFVNPTAAKDIPDSNDEKA